jgi:hypothetical protein
LLLSFSSLSLFFYLLLPLFLLSLYLFLLFLLSLYRCSFLLYLPRHLHLHSIQSRGHHRFLLLLLFSGFLLSLYLYCFLIFLFLFLVLFHLSVLLWYRLYFLYVVSLERRLVCLYCCVAPDGALFVC